MKIFSSKGKGKHANKRRPLNENHNFINTDTEYEDYESISTDNGNEDLKRKSASTGNEDLKRKSKGTENDDSTSLTKKKGRFSRLSTRKKVVIIVSCVLALALIFGASTMAVVRWRIEPFYSYFFRPGDSDLPNLPSIVILPNDQSEVENPYDGDNNFIANDKEEDEVFFGEVTRDTDNISILLLGIDAHGNTDVVMLVAFNPEKSTMNVVSIPRDTMVNVDWDIRKVNSIHAYMRNRNRGDAEKIADRTLDYFRDILGFRPNYMITVTFGAFVRVIDTVGPIPFNVPASVNVDGVSVPRGQQNLNGTRALAVMRSRNSYANHAIGRDYAQQEFLKAVATTVINAKWSVSKITDMVNIFFNTQNVTTNIPARYQVGLGRDFMELKLDDINFYMMPGAIDTARGNSYITIRVDEWLELINEKFNPYNRDITVEGVSILTRDLETRRLIVTDGNWNGSTSWGGNSTGVRNPSLTTDSSRPIPGRAPPAQVVDDGGDRNPVTGGTGGGGDGGGETADTGGGDGGGGTTDSAPGGDGGGDDG